MTSQKGNFTGAKKWGSTSFVVLLGAATAAVAASHITKLNEPIFGVIFSAITTVLGLALVVGGLWLHSRSGFTGSQRLKVAGWTGVGTVVIVIVLALMISYQLAEGADVEDPIFFVGGTTTVGAVGGFLVGLYDARRVRAEAVVTEKEKIELFNQILRHNVLNATNILHGRAQILQNHVDEDGQRHLDAVLEMSGTISELTQKVRTLIEEAEQADATVEPVDVAAVLREQIQKVEHAHEGATIHFEEEPAEAAVMADGMLPEIFENLLDNAVRHNDASEPEVYVTMEATDSSVVARIADNGPGLPDQIRRPLVEGSSSDLQETGIGLGLYLVSRFLDRYGGEMRLANRDPRGTVIDVELPRAGP